MSNSFWRVQKEEYNRRRHAEETACKGIPTVALEDGIIEKAMRAMIDLERIQRGDAQ